MPDILPGADWVGRPVESCEIIIDTNKKAEALALRNADTLLWGIRKSGCTVAVKQILIKQAIKKLLDEL